MACSAEEAAFAEPGGLSLDRLRTLDQAATPGPWYVRLMDDDLCMGATAIATEPNTSGDNDQLCDYWVHGVIAATLIQYPEYVIPRDGRDRENAELIVAMRNALPELLRLARIGAEAERAVNHPA